MNRPGEPDIPVHSGVQTSQPDNPALRFATDAPRKITPGRWSALSNDLYQTFYASNAARGPLNANLAEWAAAYDMIAGTKDWPFPNASNLALPYSATQLESLLSYVAGSVYTPRPFIVTGRTPQAAAMAPQVENYYNGEWQRLRADGTSYFGNAFSFLQLSLRDGVGIGEILWNRRRQRKRSVMPTVRLDETGQAQFGPDGQPLFDMHTEEVDVYIKDYAEWRNCSLKEFGLCPTEARSIEEAAAVWCVDWLMEDQLDRMVRAGLLDSDEVERALVYDMNGTSETASDPQGTYDKSASQQIGLGMGQGSLTAKDFKNRGPMKVIRIHSRQFDMNGDGMPEENIFWLHQLSQRMLGWTPYDYTADGGARRPFFSYCPFPRADNFYGYSILERLAGIETELRATHNSRNDRIQFGLFPPMIVQTGSEMLTRKGRWYPGEMLEGDFLPNGEPAVKILQLNDVPISSWQEEAALKQYGSEYTGLSNPMVGAQSSGRRSATEMRQQNAAGGVRLNLISARLRVSLGQIINFIHALNKQYLREDPEVMVGQQVFKLPLEVLEQDYLIGVSGSTDPIDSVTRRNESLAFFQIGMSVPEVAQSPLRRYYWLRMLGDAFNRQDLQQLIGTEQDAQQREQQFQQQQQMQAALGPLAAAMGGGQHQQPGQQQKKPQQQQQRPPLRPAG
jgi:hypothetical protein